VTAVFSHGRLRLYLLKLLAEGPKHGYELIRLLENRFLGLYAPSAGTIYPRLARMEAEGLVTHTAAGGRKVYEITDTGRGELAARRAELTSLEADIHASVADLSTLANDIEREVSGSVRDIKRELREATREAGRRPARPPWSNGTSWDWSGGRAKSQARDSSASRESGSREAAVASLERAVAEITDDVRRFAHQGNADEADIRSALAVLTGALTELRRLLRG
jgi:DNA-binding PadR family transcriptional regulator